MRIFKTKWFGRWARKQQLDDAALAVAVNELMEGLFDGDLGGQVYKKRVARPGQGKRGGLRTVVAVRFEDKAFFVYGFAKSARGNIEGAELKALKRLASELLAYEERQLWLALEAGELQEILP